MDRNAIVEKVAKIISEKLGVELSQISETSKLTEDLNADSLDLVDLVMAFEEEFDVKIDDSDLEKISTVKDIVDYIISKS
ncbi:MULTISPECIES: acyl carrier protein [Pseudothermotoga]|jgi:acyl carrier protein|uniref:Acyl carrier protein n=1 Tax=Pseudothermotoga lettingae (strain ATCC BAA-301 / DSM 14385 / NBRC 107922 / TMO) TaxID=416591 RepID=A8F857_PSELT|nr:MULTISPECIES: acyl carrier protein [Pseudothermotoga]ABV34341.1 acyl carrier protein [Pseudothermotoga lettingae TMO]KUK21192.1 MAG: Acyl carrier protein [Pseudothermotoga lettingae]MDI3494911.1 acyl carrier protein [Pseudothermotoga sp.]MDK2885042.1 acyl carrier protein [Pseudothermotoga sp.]GLI48714.1 acyl carrier protein [Pseudothermotoga lettingae TMO]